MTLKFHNTRTKTIEPFTPQREGYASLYTCGPTVYDYLHVGNWAAYIYWDTLVRTLRAYDITVERVMNITDVGHLVSDDDNGEDKLEKGARREGKTAWDVAAFYGEYFIKGMDRLNLISPDHTVKATDFIEQQLDLVRVLHDKGITYVIDDGIYFDTAKFPSYADFAGLDIAAQRAGARVEFNQEKRNPSDFALWKFSPHDEKRDMEWETPSDLVDGKTGLIGFPGWHLECSAMAMSILGDTIDIHTGGIDHIPVHHTNEIAQSEAATGKMFSNFWMHNNHIKVEGTKISKSLGNGYTLEDLEAKGFTPLDYKLFVLQSHYQSEGNFTFENLAAAASRLANWRDIAALRHQIHDTLENDSSKYDKNDTVSLYAASHALVETLGNNLDTPAALKLIDEAFGKVEATKLDDINQDALVRFVVAIDSLLGLELIESTPDIDEDTKRLIIERERVREDKDWSKSDMLRDDIQAKGVLIRDSAGGTIWSYARS